MTLAKIGEYIQIDPMTEASVIGYESFTGNGFLAAWYEEGQWLVSNPTGLFPVPVDASTISERVDMSTMRDIKRA